MLAIRANASLSAYFWKKPPAWHNSSTLHTPPPVTNLLPLPLCLFQLTELSEMSFRLNDFFFFFCTVGTLPWRQQPPQPLLPLFSHNSIKAVLTGALSHVCSWCWCVSVALLELCTLSVCCRCPMMSVSIDTALLLHLCTHPACSYPPIFSRFYPFVSSSSFSLSSFV